MRVDLPYQKILCLLLIMSSCLEPYEPPVIKADVNYLVVDGFIDGRAGSAFVQLTRANVLSAKDDPLPELNAGVSVRDDVTGSTHPLSDNGNGKHSTTGLLLDLQHTYTLLITTAEGSEYRSDPVELKQSPPIDSVSWSPSADGVQINVSTHDVSAATRYYKWEFEETWEYNSPLESGFKRVDGIPVYREINERIFVCWRNLPSTEILLGSSQRLEIDRISEFPLHFIPRGSAKLSRRYSILVRQYALSEQAFNYWQQLQKTTESLGSLFDPQPARVTSNIHNTGDPEEIVLGYFGAGAREEKRIFITYRELPRHLQVNLSQQGGCEIGTVLNADLPDLPGYYLLLNQVTQGIVVIGYTYAITACADCRTGGGSIIKPDFWD